MKRYFKPMQPIEPSESKQGQRTSKLARNRLTQWVQLILLPDSMSYDQALLLSKQSDDEWLAWVPDYGEITLHVSEFYFGHDWN